MNDNFQQAMTLVSGQTPQKAQEKQLTPEDKKKIYDAYFQLYYNLTLVNWLKGGGLGQAWFKALQQLKSFVSSKRNENPAVVYMHKMYAAHNTRWSKILMTHPYKDETIKCPTDKKQEWEKTASKNINSGLGVLNEHLRKYETKQSQTQKPESVFISTQKQMQMILQWQMQQKMRGAKTA